MLKFTLLGQLKYFLSCAAYAVGCAAYAVGCAAYAAGCAAYAVSCAAYAAGFSLLKKKILRIHTFPEGFDSVYKSQYF